jgi:hypothetical protein
MGLDIYKYEIINPSGKQKDYLERQNYFILKKTETNKNMISFFKNFKKFVVKKEGDYIDWKKSFENIGLNYSDYELRCTSHKGYEFVKKGSSYVLNIFDDEDLNNQNDPADYVLFNDEMLSVFKETVKTIYTEQIGYQRKGMKKEFYSDYLSGCWYVAESNISEDNGVYFAYNKTLLDKAKKFAENETSIKNWTLKDNECVYFSA